MSAGAIAVARQTSTRNIALVTVLVTAATLLVSVGSEIWLGTFQPGNESWRLAGIMHPVAQGWNCALLALGAAFLAASSRGRTRWWFVVIGGLAILALTITKSRVALLATVVTVTGEWLYYSRALKRWTIAVACVCAMLVGLLLVTSTDAWRHYATLGRDADTEGSLSTLTGRVPLWIECINAVTKRPVEGYGYNAFVSPANLLSLSDASGWMSSPHSAYVGTIYELGIAGAGFLAVAMVFILVSSVKRASTQDRDLFSGSVVVWAFGNMLFESFILTGGFFATFMLLASCARLGMTCREHQDVGGRSG
jgi:O-antigen ligase